jgi:hypothetical protein
MLWAGVVVGVLLVVVMAAEFGSRSSPSPSNQADASNAVNGATNAADQADVAANAAAAAAAAAEPQHNWISHENGEYGYAVGISDDARKSGQAAEQVTMYRYLGFTNGIYTVTAPGMLATCGSPCNVITVTNGYATEHIAYNPGSVIGAAFEDAINGQLEPWQAPQPSPSSSPAVVPAEQPPPSSPEDTGIDTNAAR